MHARNNRRRRRRRRRTFHFQPVNFGYGFGMSKNHERSWTDGRGRMDEWMDGIVADFSGVASIISWLI